MSLQRKIVGCFVCHKATPPYMVKESVWYEAWPAYIEDRKSNPEIFLDLCFGCLEEKLGRKLRLEDFTSCRNNDSIRLGYRLCLDEFKRHVGEMD